MNTLSNEIAQVARAALDYIDALPSDVVAKLPTMPGFDRDWAENALRKMREAVVPVEDENLPCPFCGGACDPAGWLSEQARGPECESCGATAENIDAWNRRTSPPAKPVAAPVRYMNRYTGACFTLEQQPDAATDTIVYVPLYDVARPVAVPDEMYWQDAPVEGSTRAAAYATGWNACRDAMHGSTISNSADIAIDEASQSFGNSEQLEPVSQPYKLVGEVVAWDHPTKERSVDFRWLNYDVAPGTKLYAMSKE